LTAGYNIIPVYGDAVDAEVALAAIPGLELVKDAQGNTLRKVNGSWVNNINNLEPGQAYLVKVSEDSTFYYQQ